jgi:hypothetical protein
MDFVDSSYLFSRGRSRKLWYELHHIDIESVLQTISNVLVGTTIATSPLFILVMWLRWKSLRVISTMFLLMEHGQTPEAAMARVKQSLPKNSFLRHLIWSQAMGMMQSELPKIKESSEKQEAESR